MHRIACVFSLLLATLTLAGCPAGGDDGVGGVCGSGFNPETGAVGDFGSDEAALKVEAFLRASGALYGASVDIEADVRGACNAIASDLGIPPAELEPTGAELEVT